MTAPHANPDPAAWKAKYTPPVEHEYTFDVRLVATIRVKATSEAEARKLYRAAIDGADANLGAWDSGDPILAPVSIESADDDELIEIDGEAV